MTALSTMAVALLSMATAIDAKEAELYPPVREYLSERQKEFDTIPAKRRAQLQELADYVKGRADAGERVRLTFICTHNSRRSQMAQAWAHVAARHYGAPRVEAFSGGTEATAFNPRAVAALRRAGLRIESSGEGANPRYKVRCEETDGPLTFFSKVYHEAPNPAEGFCAVMTCAEADEKCPVVAGCSLRLAIAYEDPKASDGTAQEAATYDERCRQICREMLFVFSQVR